MRSNFLYTPLKMKILKSYFDLTVVSHLRRFCWDNMKLGLWEKSSNWLLREINRATNQLELSRWALNWKRGGEQSIEIERARNFPCISWPERPSVSVSSHFEISSEQIFFIVMYCSSRQRREVWALNRAIFRNWARREFSLHFFLGSAAQREHWPACGSAPHAALKCYKLLITL